MPRILHKLRIDEVSHVDRGAGEGVKVVLMKRDDDDDLIAKRRSPRNAPSGEGPMHNEYALRFEVLRRGTALRPGEELHAGVWNSMTEAEQMQLLAEEGATEDRREREREAQRRNNMNKSTKASGDSLRAIVKSYGVMPLAKMIAAENDAHGISEAEFIQFVGEYAAEKGQSVGALLSAANGEGALLGKALAICRYAGYAKQAQQNLGDARIRARAAQLG
jgi:hypothetical protein